MSENFDSRRNAFFILFIYSITSFPYCASGNEEYEFLSINYHDSAQDSVLKDGSIGLDMMKGRSELFSFISNSTLNLTSLTIRTRRKLVLFSKLFSSWEIMDFLSKVQNMKGSYSISIGLISDTQFQLHQSYLATISEFDLSSNLYFCTYKDNVIISTLSNHVYIRLTECFELYAIKQITMLKAIPLKQHSNSIVHIFDIPELIFHEQAVRRSDFIGIPIVAETLDYKVTTYLSSFIRKSNETNAILLQKGLEIEIFRCLRDVLNFTEEAIESDGYLVMGEGKTVNNSGLAKSLYEGIADISISLAEYLPYRVLGQYGIQYLHPVYRSQAIGFFVQPQLNEHRNIFMMPFSWDLWLTIGIFISIIYCLEHLFSFISFQKPPFSKRIIKQTHSTGMWMLAAITQRGYHDFLHIQHTKMLMFTMMVASQVIYVGYTSSMCSILSVDVTPIKKFQNFEKYFSLYVDKYVPTIIFRIEWLQNMSLLHIPVTQVLKSDAIPLILSSPSALITTADEFYPAFRQHEISSQDNSACGKIDEVPIEGSYIQQGMFVKRGSPFREHFNTKLLLIRERGLQTRHVNKYFEAATLRCLDIKHSFFNTIGLKDVVLAFMFLLLVYLLSLLTLLIEVYQRRKRKIVYMW